MNLRILFLVFVASWFLQTSAAPKAAKTTKQDSHLKAETERGFQPPEFELEGNLAKIFTVTHCEYISGLTCRIHYNGKFPLPSEVFFTEFDDKGKKVGPHVRLIYPKLKRGETGMATFRIQIHPSKIILTGEWNGTWRDPY